jgi:puromycin-sensitive aminopeptidase
VARRLAAITFLAACVFFGADSRAGEARLPSSITPDRYQLTIIPDIAAARFRGEEKIEIRLAAPSREVMLHAVGLEISGARAVSQGATQPAEVRLDAEQQTLTLRFAKPLAAGAAVLAIEWKGELNRKMAGFFWAERNGKKYAFTQLEPVDARRFFPCFDEPAMKARFDVTAVIDVADRAVGNGAIVSERVEGEKKIVHFAETPPMSSYLVALGVGPLAELRGQAGKIPLRVIAPPDQVELGHYALEVAARLLPQFERYFGIPYPFGKLDLVAMPQSFGGAMENTGAIFFRDAYLLLDPATASTTARQYVALTIAHEMSHQWFGDLVTMRWWDDLWLNEAFATWAENRFGAELWPEWDLWTDFQSWLGGALAMDQLASTHAVRVPVASSAEANEAFDRITYTKGAAILRMLEMWLGEDVFRRGVARYLQAHRYGNTAADDLWRALAAESHQPVDQVARAWTDLPGLPLVTVNARCAGGKTVVDVEQQRFYVSPEEGRAGAAQSWPIPLCMRAGDHKKCEVVSGARGRVTLDSCDAPLVANGGENGYYRVRYDAATLAELTRAHDRLTTAERVGLVRDQWALVRQGSLPLARFLDLMIALRGERARPALVELVSALESLDDDVVSERERALLHQLVARLFLPLFNELGWQPKPGETDETRLLRGKLIDVLGRTAREPSILKEAEARLQKYLLDPASLDGSVADEVVHLGALSGDAARWEDFRARAKSATTPELQLRFRYALPRFEDPALVERTLALSLSDEVPPEEALGIIGSELMNPRGRDAAWRFFRAHFSELRKKAPEFGFSRLIVFTGRLCDKNSAEEVTRFFAEHPVEAAEKRVAQAVTSIQLCKDLKRRESVNLGTWLRARGERL